MTCIWKLEGQFLDLLFHRYMLVNHIQYCAFYFKNSDSFLPKELCLPLGRHGCVILGLDIPTSSVPIKRRMCKKNIFRVFQDSQYRAMNISQSTNQGAKV